MIPLLILFLLIGLTVFAATYFSRRGKTDEPEITTAENADCCGAHEACERDSLQITHRKIEYFDDEELDELAGIAPSNFSDEQTERISEVFVSLRENDVVPWLKSLQLRNISLPDSIREEALLIVGERRFGKIGRVIP